MNGNIYKAKWNGVPVYFHWAIVFMLPLLWFAFRSLSSALIAMPAFLFLVLSHEIGHAIVAQRCNVNVISIRVLGLHGLCYYEKTGNEKDDVLISWGGVAAQFVILIAALIFKFSYGLLTLSIQNSSESIVEPLLYVLIYANLYIIAYNLLPIESLDGGKAWRIFPYIAIWFKQKRNKPSEADAARNRAKMKKTIQKSSEQITAEKKKKIQEK